MKTENFTRDWGMYTKNHMNNFKLKIMVIEIMNSVDGLKKILNTSQKRVSDLKDRSVENIQIKVQTGKKNVYIKNIP